MKFLCPNCKAKYQISDEKITGRTLKMDCRRCAHPIVIRGDKVEGKSTRSSSSALKAPRQSYAGPAPARGASGRNALGADFRMNPSVPPQPQRPTALDQWHVAINDIPVGPMKREEVAKKIAAGAVDKESLCWREGLDDWRPLKNVPELASLLRRAGPAPKKQPPLPPPPSRPLGAPPRPGRPPTGRQPTRPTPSASEAQRPAARGNVVPIGGRLGASAAPKLEELSDDFADDDPTRVGAEFDFAKLEAEQAREREERARREREERERTEREERARREREERERAAHAHEEDDENVAPVGLAPSAQIAHSDAFDPFSSSAPGSIPAPAPASFAPAPPAPAPVEAVPERRQRAIPIGAWIAIAGAASFGVVLAIMVGTHFLTPAQPVAAVAPPAPAPAPAPAPDPEPLLIEDPEPEAPVEEPAVEAPAEEPAEQPAATGGRSNGTAPPRAATGTSGTATRRQDDLDPETQARLARFAGSESDQAPNLNVAGGGSTLPGEERGGSGGTELTSDQVRAVVSRERAGVQRCYETFARQSGQAPSLRLDVDVTVGASGTVTRAVARGPAFGDVNECVERTVRRWRFPRTGAESRISIPFVFTGRE